MAKKNIKKTQKTSIKKENDTIKRGRPKKEKPENLELTNDNNSSTELLYKIYGNEKNKQVIPFPNSDLQLQTKNIISTYNINTSLLPNDLVILLNDLVNDFSGFVTNPNQFHLISGIMDKDLLVTNSIKEWMVGKSELLLELKEKNPKEEKEEILVFDPVTKDSNNNPHFTEQSNNNYLENKFEPRQPNSTYQHTINNPPSQRENKDIHYQVLSEAYPSIIAQNTAQQNFGNYKPIEQPPVDLEKVFDDYCVSIYEAIIGSFQMKFWGFIPESEVKNILNNSDNILYKYEFISKGQNSYINISNGKRTIKTNFFNCK